MNERGNHYYSRSFNYTRSKNTSSLDIWVEPICFLQNHGVSRIYRQEVLFGQDIHFQFEGVDVFQDYPFIENARVPSALDSKIEF